ASGSYVPFALPPPGTSGLGPAPAPASSTTTTVATTAPSTATAAMRRRRSWRVVGRAGTPTSYACASRCDDLRVAAMISGHVAAGFEPVRHGFARLVGRREGGGALTVKLRGEIVVDLWTGYADG